MPKKGELHVVSIDKLPQRTGRQAPRRKAGYQPGKIEDGYITSLGLDRSDVALASLSDEEVKFVGEMVSNGCNKNAAYSIAFKGGKKLDGSEAPSIISLMQREDIKLAIRKGIQKRMSEALDNLDSKLLDTYITRAFYDPADFISDDGEPYALSEIRPELRCVVDGVEKKYFGKDADAFTITLKLANRDTALKTLSDFMSNVRPKAEIQVTSTVADNTEDEIQRLAEMSYDELQAELQKAQA